MAAITGHHGKLCRQTVVTRGAWGDLLSDPLLRYSDL